MEIAKEGSDKLDLTCKSNEHLVFVYGTLKRNFSYHDVMEKSIFIAEAITCDKFKLTESYVPEEERWIPYLSRTEGLVEVKGEIFKIDDKQLEFLDEFEEVAEGMYTREKIKVKAKPSDELVDVWVYVGKNDGKYNIESGNFEGKRPKPTD